MVVGLGNPGDEYVGTRHNVGFEVVEVLARELGDLLFEHPRILEGYSGPKKLVVARDLRHDVLLVEPQTFMNLSGEAVAPVTRWAGIGPEDLMVVYDDLDLPFGKLRIRPHGGAGGHNGMRSILECLGTDRFPRLRVGIGRPGTDAARHVLERFDPRERQLMDVVVAEAAEAVLHWLSQGDIEECMTRFHSRWKRDSDDDARRALLDEPARHDQQEDE